jgi:hypothetical protein
VEDLHTVASFWLLVSRFSTSSFDAVIRSSTGSWLASIRRPLAPGNKKQATGNEKLDP